MPRKNLIRSNAHPYHVTGRANNRESFHLELQKVWDILSYSCFEATVVHGARIHSLVVMPNHFHMLISTPKSDLGVIMEQFMRSITKTMNTISGRSGRVFGGPYHWTLINSTLYFVHAYKYVYRNPVCAGLCHEVESYLYSTFSGLIGNTRLHFPLHFPFDLGGYLGIPDNPIDQIAWLNKPFLVEQETAIQKAFRKTTFSSPKTDWRRSLEILWL